MEGKERKGKEIGKKIITSDELKGLGREESEEEEERTMAMSNDGERTVRTGKRRKKRS